MSFTESCLKIAENPIAHTIITLIYLSSKLSIPHTIQTFHTIWQEVYTEPEKIPLIPAWIDLTVQFVRLI